MLKYTIADFFNVFEKINIGKGSFTGKEPEHIHEFIEITYILSGKVTHKIGDNYYDVSRGDLLFINFQQTHAYVSENGFEYVNILVLPTFISDELINSENALDMLTLSIFEEFTGEIDRIVPYIHFDRVSMVKIEKIINDMLYEFTHKQKGYQTALKGMLQILLVNIFRQMHSQDGETGILEHVGKIAPEVLQFIEDNCFEKFSISDLAKRNFYNPSYFSRAFKECFGVTLTAYVQKKRIDEAIRLLKETDLSVEKVGQSVGYCDKKQFYKSFRDFTGTSPGKFRQSLKK